MVWVYFSCGDGMSGCAHIYISIKMNESAQRSETRAGETVLFLIIKIVIRKVDGEVANSIRGMT